MDALDDVRLRRLVRELVEQCPYVTSGEALETKLALRFDRRQRLAQHRSDLGCAVGCEEQHARIRDSTRQLLQQQQRRVVREVQILDDDEQRVRARTPLDEGCHRFEHAEPCTQAIVTFATEGSAELVTELRKQLRHLARGLRGLAVTRRRALEEAPDDLNPRIEWRRAPA